MSQNDSGPRFDLNPVIPKSLHFTYLIESVWILWWVFYRPRDLATYIHTRRSASRDLDMSNLNDAATIISAAFPAFFLLCIWFADITITYLLRSFDLIDAAPLGILDLCVGLFAVIVGAPAIRLLFCRADVSAKCISLQVMLSMTLNTAVGLVLMYVGPSGRSFIFAGLGLGIFLGLVSVRIFHRFIQLEKTRVLWFVMAFAATFLTVFIVMLALSSRFMIAFVGLLTLWVTAASWLISVWRIDDWLLGRIRWRHANEAERISVLPHVTPIRVKWLEKILNDRLIDHWPTGLQECLTIEQYTNQTRSVRHTISKLLKERSEAKQETLVEQCEQAWEAFSPLAIVANNSTISTNGVVNNNEQQADIDQVIMLNSVPDVSSFIPSLVIEPNTALFPKWVKLLRQVLRLENKQPQLTRDEKRKKERMAALRRSTWRPNLSHKIAINSPVAGAIGGYWYLEKAYPKDAESAFKEVEFSKFAEEMKNISQALEMLWQFESIPELENIKLPKRPKEPKHAKTWESFEQFKGLARQVWLLKNCADLDNFSRTVDHIITAFNMIQDSLPDFAERATLFQISEDWWAEITDLFMQTLFQDNLKTISNPFVTVEPLASANKSLLVGRKSALDQLKAAWIVRDFTPVLICGQSHSGKSSLIRCAEGAIETELRMVRVNSRQLSTQPCSLDILQAILEQIGQQNIYHKTVVDNLVQANSYPLFRSYMKEVCLHLGQTGLVVVLDEFEFIEREADRVEVGKLMSFLWSLSQSEPNLGIVFLTTTTLPELNKLFDTPFTRSLQPITLEFLNFDEIASLLRNPVSGFLPYCHDSAIQYVLDRTAGQPYLVQSCAAALFERYNNRIRAELAQDPLLTAGDVEEALKSNSFNLQCERYYRGICDEALQIDKNLTIKILVEIARFPSNPSREQIMPNNKHQQKIDSIIDTLADHLILERLPSQAALPPRWRIKVPLFYEWLQRQ